MNGPISILKVLNKSGLGVEWEPAWNQMPFAMSCVSRNKQRNDPMMENVPEKKRNPRRSVESAVRTKKWSQFYA